MFRLPMFGECMGLWDDGGRWGVERARARGEREAQQGSGCNNEGTAQCMMLGLRRPIHTGRGWVSPPAFAAFS